MPEAYIDLISGETTETNLLDGEIGFHYAAGEGTFVVTKVRVEFAYKEELFARWTVRFAVEPQTIPDIVPLLETLGTTQDQLFALEPDQQFEVSMSAQPDLLARLSPQLLKMSKLTDMFLADNGALLNLDNYQDGNVQLVQPGGEPPDTGPPIAFKDAPPEAPEAPVVPPPAEPPAAPNP